MDFDIDFINRLINKDKKTHTSFYLKTVDIFFRYLNSVYVLTNSECEDIISSFYIRFWSSVSNYDKEYSFESFVWLLFRNITKDYFKKHKERYFTEFDNDCWTFDENLENEEDLSLKDFLNQDFQQEFIQKAIEELDQESKMIVYWKFIEDKTYSEIADLLQITVVYLRKKLSRILKKLRQRLKQYE